MKNLRYLDPLDSNFPANRNFQLKALRQRIVASKGVSIREGTILWALRSQLALGDDDAAYRLLLALSDASEGMTADYNASIKMRGAQNRQGVTCYLDSTLFSMFSRLDSFEAMLYNTFNDLPRNRLSFLLRIWVNLLRSGQLITADITEKIQRAISDCGWREAAELHQQDASEAFTFITEKLDLPLLTLKMDIFHTGKEDAADDHKFINERLLDVAIPEDPNGHRKEITLEDCLEAYFNNRIEVRRYLEKKSTVSSVKSVAETKTKGASLHVETIEVDPDSSPGTPTSHFPPSRPTNKGRSQSIIQERYFPARGESGYSSLTNVESKDSGRSRAGSVRKEVMMPAWQFFSLIPWYTDHAPSSDAQVAAHFSSKRPVLGLCLKRYAFRNGKPVRLNTYIDIPVEIGLPHFIQDDHMSDDSAAFGNFKLSLQSAVCHRGSSTQSGHYVALVRSTSSPESASSHWLRFDDLAPERITAIDIEKTLKEEMPYLLFYQITPVEGDPGQITAGEHSRPVSPVEERPRGDISATSLPLSEPNTTNIRSGRQSFDVAATQEPRGRSPFGSRRPSAVSLTVSRGSSRNLSPGNRSHSRNGSGTLTNISSKTSENIGRTLSKLTKRRNRDGGRDTHEDIPTTEVHIREVSNVNSMPSVRQTKPEPSIKPQPHTLNVPHPPHPTYTSHKRERSKNRLSKAKGKDHHHHHPDRECVVM